MRIYEDITKTIGKTPLVRLNRMNEGLFAKILLKLEFFNPLSSVKDRPGVFMMEMAEKKGLIKKDTVIVEPTAGNMGLALSMICASRNLKFIAVMPENVSIERVKLLKFLGAEVILTSKEEGMDGAVRRAFKIKEERGGFIPMQFENENNPLSHYKTTGPEIFEDTEGKIDIFIAGSGTGGTISGVSKYLKEKKPSVKTIAVEPAESPLLSGGKPSPHKIQGIGPNFVPKNFKRELVDEIIKVKGDDAVKTSKLLAETEGIAAGISSGANLFAAIEVAKREENKEKLIVVMIPDTAERYFSTELFYD